MLSGVSNTVDVLSMVIFSRARARAKADRWKVESSKRAYILPRALSFLVFLLPLP